MEKGRFEKSSYGIHPPNINPFPLPNSSPLFHGEKKMVDFEFWKKWVEANEIEKEKLIMTLPMFTDIRCPLFSPGLLNSYFEDLYLFLKDHLEDKFLEDHYEKN